MLNIVILVVLLLSSVLVLYDSRNSSNKQTNDSRGAPISVARGSISRQCDIQTV